MERKKRIAVIEFNKCQPQKCNFLCIRVCPVNKMGKECIIENIESKKPFLSEELCAGCGICVHKCPFSAISIINLSPELSQPLHQFGENAFRLYGMALPKEKSVIGLIGKNGIGKSTLLKILSNQLIPNFGELKEKPSFDNAINFFKGKQEAVFFKKLKASEAKLSFKPQNIDLIQSKAQGKVKDLLEKVNESNELEEIVKDLGIESILSHDIKEVSGGEMQRIAIAATVLKNAEIFFFDEPSSYLDVKQRLNLGKVLRKLAEKNKSVIVVEHDLALLDYLSDYIHIFYGKPAVYGVISQIKSSKNGINEFLQGFLKDENLRFREKELTFEVKPPGTSRKKKIFLEYPALEKKFSGFELSTEKGALMQGEVIGVLGPNAIGKTTFVKMLAGEIKPDNVKVDLKAKVSFKPQHLVVEKNSSVRALFDSKEIDKELLRTEIERRLNLKDLMDLELKQLSGGELQKVAVAFALCREADLYLLDEPSAFVDIEDRLRLADAIRSVIEKTGKAALIVEHDIVFQDYVADRLIVFEGVPSKNGFALSPKTMLDGMNHFLNEMQITFRRDENTGRPRANKLDSFKDREQKQKNQFYYSIE